MEDDSRWSLVSWLKAAVVFIVVVVAATVYLWPVKTGDIKVVDGKTMIFWRGPDSGTPGKWLPKNEEVDPGTIVNCPELIAGVTKVSGKSVVDCISLGRGRCLIVLGDGTAAFVKSDRQVGY